MNAVAQQEEKSLRPQPVEEDRPYVSPPVNIVESKDGYVLEAEMPGVAKDGLEISLEANVLTLTGRRGPSDFGLLNFAIAFVAYFPHRGPRRSNDCREGSRQESGAPFSRHVERSCPSAGRRRHGRCIGGGLHLSLASARCSHTSWYSRSCEYLWFRKRGM